MQPVSLGGATGGATILAGGAVAPPGHPLEPPLIAISLTICFYDVT